MQRKRFVVFPFDFVWSEFGCGKIEPFLHGFLLPMHIRQWYTKTLCMQAFSVSIYVVVFFFLSISIFFVVNLVRWVFGGYDDVNKQSLNKLYNYNICIIKHNKLFKFSFLWLSHSRRWMDGSGEEGLLIISWKNC